MNVIKLLVKYLGAAKVVLPLLLIGCSSAPLPGEEKPAGPPSVLAVETWLGDLALGVTGDRLQVDTLISAGLDPHSFEPTPRDVARIAECDILVVNGAGLEEWLDETLANAGGVRLVINASSGLESRRVNTGEKQTTEAGNRHLHEDGDPHFWLDPVLAIRYVENIRDGLIRVDPEGKTIYDANTSNTIDKLLELDAWIRKELDVIPAEQRLLVTNHESLGYFADRYGFKVVGTIIPSFSTNASPSAKETAALVDVIHSRGVRAIFLETGANPTLAEQVSRETGIRVVSGLYTHSTSSPKGPAPTYFEMMKENTRLIKEGLR